MAATVEQIEDTAEAIVAAIDLSAFVVGSCSVLRLTTDVYEVRLAEHGEHESEPIVVGE
jgi:hypothetical protein